MIWKFPSYEIGSKIDWDYLNESFDWLRDMKGVPQNPQWHAEGDVYNHTKMVIDTLVSLPEFQKLHEQDKHILFTAALLHDVEKRSTTTTEDIDGISRIVSPNHSKKGEYTSRKLLYKDIVTPFAIREEIVNLVKYHGLPLWTLDKDNPVKDVIKVSLVLNTELLYLLSKVDVLGRLCEDKDDLLLKIELFKELCIENDCFGKKRQFKSDYSRYLYLNRYNGCLDYEPFENFSSTVYMLSAIPGTGKDTYIKNNLNCPTVSLDDIRRERKISHADKKGMGEVVQIGKEMCKEYLRKKTSFVLNATNFTKDMRGKWITLFTDYNARVKIIYLEVPYKQLISQNRNRKYVVPDVVLETMLGKLEIPTYDEAHELDFSCIQG